MPFLFKALLVYSIPMLISEILHYSIATHSLANPLRCFLNDAVPLLIYEILSYSAATLRSSTLHFAYAGAFHVSTLPSPCFSLLVHAQPSPIEAARLRASPLLGLSRLYGALAGEGRITPPAPPGP